MAVNPEAAVEATRALPGIPQDADGPVFREPWEAQAFAMALALHARGLFTWNEWAAALASEVSDTSGVTVAANARPARCERKAGGNMLLS